MRLPGFLAALTLLVLGCTPGQPTYLDRVRALVPGKAHPLVQELLPLLGAPGRNPDDLARTWKEFVGTRPLPLRQDSTVTFVYYDFAHRLDQVFLEASFAPDRREPLTRWKQTPFFYSVYEVPRLDRLEYRFTDGTGPLVDPFFASADPEGLWHRPSVWTDPAVEFVAGTSESLLAGQDLTVVIPPGYHRNLAAQYGFVLLVSPPDDWVRSTLGAHEGNLPAVVVAVDTPPTGTWTVASLKGLLEERVVPWVRLRYRVSPLPADLTLAAWGPAVAATRDLNRPDFWTKILTPGTDVRGFLATLYPVETP